MTRSELLELLGCAALEPKMGAILFVNLDPRLLLSYAEMLADAIAAIDGSRPQPTIIGSGTSNEQLWPDWGVTVTAEQQLTLGRRPGLLHAGTAAASGALLVVPDLARAGLPVVRAAVMTLDADVVHVERNGISTRWHPRARWLAACDARDMPALSAHLLDRFPVRVDGATMPQALDPSNVALADLLGRASADGQHRQRPSLPEALTELVLRVDGGRPSVRRSLALARTARAVAERRGGTVVEPDDVVRAAAIIGVAPASQPVAPTPTVPEPDLPMAPRSRSDLAAAEPTSPIAPEEGGRDIDDFVLAEPSTPADAVAPVEVAYLDPLRPEDAPDALPQPHSLRWAVTGVPATRRATGTIIGHEPSADLHDLALVPTLIHAWLRTWSSGLPRTTARTRPTVLRQDLRRYQRKHGPHCALVLVLDHTALRSWDCSPGLAPHLQWAYHQTATVSMVEFGHDDSPDELRPERYRAASVADPRIARSLRRSPGVASPLAAGVELAVHELRRHMHRGWASVRSARLVVVTDGRGNVPLEVSAERRLTGRVAREGVEDALAAARTIAGLHRVETTVVAPVDEQYPDLTADLAFALGATLTVVDGGAVPRGVAG